MTLDGKRVRRFLDSNGKSREWLAVQLRCSRETADRILAGKTPTGERLVALAKVMGCQVEDLIAPEAVGAAKRTA